MRKAAFVFLAALLVVGCGSSDRTGSHRRVMAGGCGDTRVYRGAPPTWTASAFGSSSPGFANVLPYAVAEHGNAAGFIFGYPLRAGAPSNRRNKILWIVRLPRNGSELTIRGTPLDGVRPVITVSSPANSSPGEIYPSIVNVPAAGCWRMTLHWAGHTDALDLAYLS